MAKRLDCINKMQVLTNIILKEMNKTNMSSACALPVMTVRPQVKPSISEELSALASHTKKCKYFQMFVVYSLILKLPQSATLID